MNGIDGGSQFGIPGTPFPVGVEYYRAPTPKRDVWEEDFVRIRAAGFRIVRSFSYWNWMEPAPGRYELDDFDEMFDLAGKHELFVWLDITLATHGACPEWLIQEHPDVRVVNYLDQAMALHASPSAPQGGAIHCYDHPAWREHGGRLLRHVVRRYKDRPNLLVWGLWDGINLSSGWSRLGHGYPCYCPSTLGRYKAWLRERYTLDALNARLLRRYRRWDDVEPPRSNQNVVEMLLYREFHYENLAAHLRWMVDEVKQIDPRHEVRAHGLWSPRPWDERCAQHVDSWGMSMPSNNLLSSRDPYQLADRAFSFDWARLSAQVPAAVPMAMCCAFVGSGTAEVMDVLVDGENCRGAHVSTRPHNRKVIYHKGSDTWSVINGLTPPSPSSTLGALALLLVDSRPSR